MGADGGSIPDRRDLVKTKGKAQITDKALLRDLFLLCALSKKPLVKPVVADPLGKLYNKDAVLEYLIDKSAYGDGDQICGYLKGVKDLLTLNLMPNPSLTVETITSTSTHQSRAPFVCPLTLKEMSGSLPFIALRPCGCVFSEAAIRSVIPTLTRGALSTTTATTKDDLPDEAKAIVPAPEGKEVTCPNCGKLFDPTPQTAILPINPTKEVTDVLLESLLLHRASIKSSKKRKNPIDTESDSLSTKQPKKSNPPPAAQQLPLAPSIKPSTVGGSVKEMLAEQERKRKLAQEGMSDAVKAMFKPKEKDGEYHKGNADFFGRTFTRYAA